MSTVKCSTQTMIVPSNARSRLRLPVRLCSLDLETTKTDFHQPELSTLLFVGTREYRCVESGYRGGRHRVWTAKELTALQHYLQSFEGVIVGHNILRFDYQVLRPHVDLKGVIEKTVDTLALCWWKRWHIGFDTKPDIPRYLSWRIGPEVKNLGLDNLARRNLRAAKTMDAKRFQTAWREDRASAFRYNAQDCGLTKRLWVHLIQRKPLRIMPGITITLSQQEVAMAARSQPWTSFEDWDLWRRVDAVDAMPGDPDWIPMRRCPRCGDWQSWARFDEALSGSDWTEGQMMEWLAGNWGTAYCGNCGLVLEWEDGRHFSFDLEAKVISSAR